MRLCFKLHHLSLKSYLQLVGTALILLVKSHLAGQIRNVEGATKKVRITGRYTARNDVNCIADRSQRHVW